jgi:hypothetical protein
MHSGEVNNHLGDHIEVKDDENSVKEDFCFSEGELWYCFCVLFDGRLMSWHAMIMAEKENSNYQRYFPLRLCYVTRLSSSFRLTDLR